MNKIHITSVGASIITNFKRENPTFTLPNIDEDNKFENVWTDKAKFEQILDYANRYPFKASAELNALKGFIENNDVTEVHLIVTDTFVGKITSEVIKQFLSTKNINCTSKTIPGYYKESAKNEEEAEEKFIKGLSDLRDSLIEFIKGKKINDPGCEILINATGGFKPEILILMLVGSLTNCKVYYIHEFFKRILFLPPIFLPYLNNSVADALQEINHNAQKRISGETQCAEFQKEYSSVYHELLDTKLISEKFGEKDDKLFEIKITSYGKLLADVNK